MERYPGAEGFLVRDPRLPSEAPVFARTRVPVHKRLDDWKSRDGLEALLKQCPAGCRERPA